MAPSLAGGEPFSLFRKQALKKGARIRKEQAPSSGAGGASSKAQEKELHGGASGARGHAGEHLGPNAESSREGPREQHSSGFRALGLSSWIVRALDEMSLTAPTPVQRHCIPRILEGKSVFGRAETGSGKTAAFALPILQLLSRDPYGVFALVLTPTRELAFQISDQFAAFGAPLGVRISVVVGGMDQQAQAMALHAKPHVVIATPGRLLAHLQNAGKGSQSAQEAAKLAFRRTRFLVLDEADRLLDPSFEDELSSILQLLPEDRQTLSFSATMTRTLRYLKEGALQKAREAAESEQWDQEALRDDELAQEQKLRQLQSKGVYVYEDDDVISDDEEEIEAVSTISDAKGGQKRSKRVMTVKQLDQRYVLVPAKVKEVYLVHLLREAFAEQGTRSAIIFTSTCRGCHLLTLTLQQLKLPCAALHSLQPQRERLRALDQFKCGSIPLLVATDVAARGLDIPTVDVVYNFDLPPLVKEYVHRVGRTARAGRHGKAISFVTQFDVSLTQQVEAYVGKKLEEEVVDEAEVLKGMSKVYSARREALMEMNDGGFEEALQARKKRRKQQRQQQ